MYQLNSNISKIGITLIILIQCGWILLKETNEYTATNNKESLVEVRAVFINCEPDDKNDGIDSDISRFQRQELFKHNALHDCNKKLALTIKMSSEYKPDWPESVERTEQMLNDEYIPIDHVFEGSNRKRVRLLNPYVLRLRREGPKQAYKLHRIETVSGVLLNSGNFDKNRKNKNQRTRRHMDGSELDELGVMLGSAASVFALERDNPSRHSYTVRIGRLGELMKPKTEEATVNNSKECDKREACLNKMSLARDKRSISIGIEDDAKRNNLNIIPASDERRHNVVNADFITGHYVTDSFEKGANKGDRLISADKMETSQEFYDSPEISIVNESNVHKYLSKKSNFKTHFTPERDFTMYDIGAPSLWYAVNIQLFEKLSTPEGKTVWNDLTKGELASVSSSSTEWKGPDLNIRYRPAEWLPRDDFSLPMTSLCLLEPLRENNYTFDDDIMPENDEYIVVPKEDITCINRKIFHKRNENDSSGNDSDPPNANQEVRRQVQIRVSRAIFGSGGDSFRISAIGDERFLILPHQRPHHAQIDLEVRADDNQLVRIGSSGRISTVVVDSTRKSRTVLSLQATNTGLASARFKAVARECGPELMTLVTKDNNEEIITGPVILPPQHTRRMHLDIPVEIPADVTHCNVALVNDDDDAVAVREVTIKKGDRCFCVWHCECVCLTDDPKLLCREMSPPQQVAAGLSTAERPRHARSICYNDVPGVDVTSSAFGVITFLFILGFIKAVIGMVFRSIGMLGLGTIIRLPRRLNRYYEKSLSGRNVVYDCEGWPVDPDTRTRSVRLISRKAQFILNLILFLLLPIITFKICCWRLCRKSKPRSSKRGKQQDIQTLERLIRRLKHGRLCPWMTEQAAELSKDVVQGGLKPTRSVQYIMQPLLHETTMGSKSELGMSGGDSEQEDTDYVLMQMKKSRESLQKTQKKVDDDAPPPPPP